MERVNDHDKARLSALAKEWMQIAGSEKMQERKARWRDINDLKSSHPTVRTDAFILPGFVTEGELKCTDVELRQAERYMTGLLRQYHEIGDDVVLEPYFRIPWKVDSSDMGVAVTMNKAVHGQGDEPGYSFENPIRQTGDLLQAGPRAFKRCKTKMAIL